MTFEELFAPRSAKLTMILRHQISRIVRFFTKFENAHWKSNQYEHKFTIKMVEIIDAAVAGCKIAKAKYQSICNNREVRPLLRRYYRLMMDLSL